MYSTRAHLLAAFSVLHCGQMLHILAVFVLRTLIVVSFYLLYVFSEHWPFGGSEK